MQVIVSGIKYGIIINIVLVIEGQRCSNISELDCVRRYNLDRLYSIQSYNTDHGKLIRYRKWYSYGNLIWQA